MKVISWNILADEFISKKYYPTIPIKLLNREKRIETIINRLKNEKADVVLLQEVMIKEHNTLKETFNNFFVSNLILIKCKYPNEYGRPHESGTVILLRKSIFSDFKYISRDEFCIISCLYNNKKVCFANVHLDDLSSITRFNQLIRVIEKTNKFNKVIIGGDMNQKYDENSYMYKFFKLNRFKPSVINNDPTYYIDKSQSIDNIMFKGFKLESSNVSNDCGKRTLGNIICQINNYGSDHFPIIVNFL